MSIKSSNQKTSAANRAAGVAGARTGSGRSHRAAKSAPATKVESQMLFFCGPYKGYHGRAEWDPEAGFFHGDVTGTRDVITFVGKTYAELEKEFVNSIEDYLAMCAKHGLPPDKPFSGKFVVRIKPEVHRKLSAIAEYSKSSLNQLISDALESIANGLPTAHAAAIGAPPISSRQQSKFGRVAAKQGKLQRQRRPVGA